MTCIEVQKFVHPYLDGEFEERDRGELERHLGDCAECRRMVSFEASFQQGLRARLRRPAAPAGLRGRIHAALDRADAAGEGPVPALWKRALPATTAALVAAAAVLLFLVGSPSPSLADPQIVEDAIRSHEKNLPVEVAGNEDRVKTFFAGRMPVPVRPPLLPASRVALVGARIGHLRGRDAAQLVYRVNESPVTVYIFDPSDVSMQGWQQRRVVANHVVYVSGARGYNVLFYRERGVGYAFTSDLDQDQMLELIQAAFQK